MGSKFLLEAEMTKVSIKNLEYEKWIIRKDKCSHDTHRHCNRVRLEPSSCCVWYCWCWVFSMLFVAPHLVMLILSNYITNQSFHFLILFLFWVFFSLILYNLIFSYSFETLNNQLFEQIKVFFNLFFIGKLNVKTWKMRLKWTVISNF